MTYPAATANLVVLWGRWWDHLTKVGVDATITATPLLATGQVGSGSPNLVSLVDQAEIKTAAWTTRPLASSGLWALPLLPTNDAQFGAFGGYRIQCGSEPPFIVEILENTPTMTMSADMIAALNEARLQSSAAAIGISVDDVAQAVWVRQAAVLPQPAVTPPAGVLTSDQVVNLVAGVRQLPPGGSPGQVPTPKVGGGYEWVVQSGGGGGGGQAADPDLTAIAALDSATPGAIASDGSGWIKKTYAQFKAALGLVKGDVGLGNVDNTSDTAKPVSTAQQTALNAKAATAHTHSAADLTATGTRDSTTVLFGDNTWKTPPAGGGGSMTANRALYLTMIGA